jgi:EAL domain-containing protein (putative c-di-GMP-specific phosphodiesterase class I)
VRLIDEDGTVYTPYHFLEVAKRTKYYQVITRRMVTKAFIAFKNRQEHFSINISYLDFTNEETMRFIYDQIQLFPDPERIHFEILESEGIERYEDVIDSLKRLKTLGCHISLDDFGSGYSSFEHILKLEVDMLKIDGSLIKNIDTDISSQIIVETIVEFAKKLGITTCAEFITSESVYETVREMGVDYLQGYYLGKPKPLDDLL